MGFKLGTGNIGVANSSGAINKAYLGNTLVYGKSNGIDFGGGNYFKPVIYGFNITNAQPTRVNFSSLEPLSSGSTFTGFTISGKTINGININSGSTTGHYFTVNSAFNFWDNNTIRYEGVALTTESNISDGSDGLYDFTLTYIRNDIVESSTTNNIYATSDAVGGGSGTIGSPYTFQEAMAALTGDTTLWLEAGNYGDETFYLNGKTGTATAPIKIIGYKTSEGDITANYWGYTTTTTGDYAATWNVSEMPTFTGTDPNTQLAFQLENNSYLIFRNIQITNYKSGITSVTENANHFIHVDNCNFMEFGSASAIDSKAIYLSQTHSGTGLWWGNENSRITNNVIINPRQHAIEVYGDGFNLIENNKTYCDIDIAGQRLDYHIDINGNNSIIKDCYAENFFAGDNVKSSHGIGIYGRHQLENEYNLIVGCTAVTFQEGFYVRNFGCNYNVIKDCHVKNNGNVTSLYRGAFWVWGNSNYNIFENCTADDVRMGIGWKDNTHYTEDGTPKPTDYDIGDFNEFRNCTFNNTRFIQVLFPTVGTTTGTMDNNKLINCTFNNSDYMWYGGDYPSSDVVITNHQIINCIFNDIGIDDLNNGLGTTYSSLPTFDYTYCSFNGTSGQWSETAQTGTGNIVADPQFSTFPTPTNTALVAGTPITGVEYDLNKLERDAINPTIGAKEI